MAQHDMNIANQGFPAFRADLNSALTAIANNSSGATAPSTTFAYQWWYDTSTNALKMRNADNDAWIQIGTFNQTTDSFTPSGVTSDKISEGNSSIEIVDTGTGYAAVVIDGVETARFASGGNFGLANTNPTDRLSVGSSSNRGTVAVYGTASSTPVISIDNTAAASGRRWSIYGGASANGNIDLVDTTGGGIIAASWDSSYNFKYNSGYGSVATAYGCRAWVVFDGTGTVAITGSGNVSSLNDVGTGNYRVNFSTSIVDANYTCAITAGHHGGEGAGVSMSGGSNGVTNAYMYASQNTALTDFDQIQLVVVR